MSEEKEVARSANDLPSPLAEGFSFITRGGHPWRGIRAFPQGNAPEQLSPFAEEMGLGEHRKKQTEKAAVEADK